MGIKDILFVCTGNTCRSCMAEAIFRNAVGNLENKDKKQGLGKIKVSSAGIAATCNAKASDNSVKVLEEWGIDLRQHLSRQLTDEMVRNADLILTMELRHKNFILKNYPEYKDKVYTLKEYAHDNGTNKNDSSLDIDDPYMNEMDVYRECAEDIKAQIHKIINRIFF